MRRHRLYPGDVVEVKSPDEILATLDADGTADQLPFMPEMMEFCGKRFRVSKRVLKTCMSASGLSTMRGLKTTDVITLEGVRCGGAEHGGCQKQCMVFWREAWLRKVKGDNRQPKVRTEAGQQLRSRLKTMDGPDRYFCQASELLKYTDSFVRSARLRTCWKDVRAGNCSSVEMVRRIVTWVYWRFRKSIVGEYAGGSNKTTPIEALNLSSGEQVQVKCKEEITATTNSHAQNRGLYFSPDMASLCGRETRVRTHLDKIIVDGTGEMRELRNTVYLDGSMCGCAHVAFGGCPRGEFSYWREIWLRRQARS